MDRVPAAADPRAHPFFGDMGFAVTEDLDPAPELLDRTVPSRSTPPSLRDDARKRTGQAEQDLGGGITNSTRPRLIAETKRVSERFLDGVEAQ
jgi:hypothetical protein